MVDENDIPYFMTICKPKISEYCNTANKLFCMDVLFKLTSEKKAKVTCSRERFAHENARLCEDFDLIKTNHNQLTWVVA